MFDKEEIVMSLIRSLCLCDHMGDVADDILQMFKVMGVEYKDEGGDFFEDLITFIDKEYSGVPSIWQLAKETQ